MLELTGGKRRASRAIRLCTIPSHRSRAREKFFVAGCAILLAIEGCASSAPGLAFTTESARQSAWAFVAPGDRSSDSSVHANAAALDAVVSGWLQLDSLAGRPVVLYPDPASRIPAPTRRLVLVTSWSGQRFHPEEVRRIAANRAALAQVASRIASVVAEQKYAGVVFDLEDQSRADLPLVTGFIRAAGDSVRSRFAASITVALPAADTSAYPTRPFLAVADNVLIMLYDAHVPSAQPAAITSPERVRRLLAQRVSDVGPARVIAALPVFSCLWRNNQPAQMLSYNDALHAATEANVDVQRDPTSSALHAVKPGDWELWVTDAQQLHALRAEVTALGIGTVAFWRLGQEQAGTLTRAP